MASIQNQLTCVEFLRDNLGWEDYKCAALVGCMMAESGINPQAVNKGEKNGTLKVEIPRKEEKPKLPENRKIQIK